MKKPRGAKKSAGSAKAGPPPTASATKASIAIDPRWIYLVPIVAVLWVWLSSLSFVPVPWPDDSAFYFPAKDLFSWPPRWVMIPQAPFEPSYREWNFNTMPLLPILIGIARAIGIAGTHGLKLLPLGGWLLGIFVALRGLRRGRASTPLLLAAAGVLAFDPVLRWSSVLIRPESMIGAAGMAILFGFRFGWPEFLRERRYFHPASLALLAGALLHFNAIHLVPLVIVLYAADFRKIAKIGALTAVGLVPWGATILAKPAIFAEQMELQFSRLAGYRNPWLSSWPEFTKALLGDMGSPEAWGAEYSAAILACVAALPALGAATAFLLRGEDERGEARWRSRVGSALLGAVAWFVSGLYLWHTKAEVWFTHYFHLAFWAWTILVAYELRARAQDGLRGSARVARWAVLFPAAIGAVFLAGQIAQTVRLESTETWHWRTYDAWIDCIDSFLTEERARRGGTAVFRVWDPTFPDITLALSRRHPDWEFTRTNDFYTRWELGVRHGYEVDAMVVTEIYRTDEVTFRGELAARPGARSVWMEWENYFLNRLARDPKFKPRRFLCQNGRWDAFIYLNGSN